MGKVRYNLLILFLSFFWAFPVKSQTAIPVKLSFNKTVHIFFASNIDYVDVGSESIIFTKKDYILKLVAKEENFAQTNMTVITSDGYCYSFLVDYSADITVFNIFMKVTEGKKLEIKDKMDVDSASSINKKDEINTGDNKKMNEVNSPDNKVVVNKHVIENFKTDEVCEKALKKADKIWEGAYNKKVFLFLNNIFIENEKLYFVFSVGNESNINYDVDYINLTVKDKKTIKRASIQEVFKDPVLRYKQPIQIKGKTDTFKFVVVFEKFTVPDNKKLVFEMDEKNGGRYINFELKKDLIIEAEKLK